MFKGRIDLIAPVIDGTITFGTVEFVPPWLTGAKGQLACPEADSIVGTVWVTGAQLSDDVVRAAQTIFEAALSRLAYSLQLAIGLSRVIASEVEPEAPSSGYSLTAGTGYYYLTGHPAQLRRSVDTASVQQALEVASPLGEQNYSEFRSARLSTGPVEEFMHLYRLLLELCGDSQRAVEDFIVHVEPSVPTTPSPLDPAKSETLYTRLRNELAHKRPGADLAATKYEMANCIGLLRHIAREAILKLS